MANDISGFGTIVLLRASVTFPEGLEITQFADDADAFDLAEMTIADKAMGVNGDLVTWSKATSLDPSINVIPGSDDDTNLGILFEANRVGSGKVSAADVINLTVIYPDGTTDTYTNGKMLTGMPGKSLASSGRFKTKKYGFAFENRTGAGGL